jgi:hypothetical protein
MGAFHLIDNIAGLVNANAGLVHRGRVVDVKQGPFITPDYSFALRAPRSVWEKFWQPLPPLGFTDIFALVKQRLMRVEGDLHPFMANLLYFKGVIAARGSRDIQRLSRPGARKNHGFGVSRKRPSGSSVSGSKVRSSVVPLTSIVTTMWSPLTAVDTTLAPAGSACATSAKDGALFSIRDRR